MAEKRRKALYEALKENEKVRVQFSPFGGSGSSSSVQQSRLVQPSLNVGLIEFDCMSRVRPPVLLRGLVSDLLGECWRREQIYGVLNLYFYSIAS